MAGIYDDHGVRFRYPDDWEIEVTDEGSVRTVALHSSTGPAFALVTMDDTRPDPADVADQALEAMREEYPQFDASPASESFAGHEAVGHDVEFFALDVPTYCAIRCFRTDRRTVLVFGQWPDDETDEGDGLESVRRSFEETDEE
ncbi:MAG: hypothetical protein U0835_03620 [Isosphaeraceae bacterium]